MIAAAPRFGAASPGKATFRVFIFEEEIVPTDLKKIEHIFVVMMENRSFDHLLGYLDLAPHNRTDIIGIKDAQSKGYGNLRNGTKYTPQPRIDPAVPVDPLHEREPVAQQMQWRPGDPLMTGFVADYVTVSPNDAFPALEGRNRSSNSRLHKGMPTQ